ncbi:hypothetical protein FACS189499_04640 [Clostridia bacterium]|nr:hypothetical protein FACS189499_04640 [Clostridia bacterium]
MNNASIKEDIIFDNVTKTFGKSVALSGLNLKIKKGTVHALLGHSGAGKTTSLRLLLGLYLPTTGSVSVLGINPTDEGDKIREMCGVLSESYGLYEQLTVYDNLRFYAEIYGMSAREYNEKIDFYMSLFEMSNKKWDIIKGFSRGEKLRVAIIRAILHEPKLLILDEPSNGLDPVNLIRLRDEIKKLTDSGTTVVLTTHNLKETEKMADYISILKSGKNLLTISMEELKTDEKYKDDKGNFDLEKFYLDFDSRTVSN